MQLPIGDEKVNFYKLTYKTALNFQQIIFALNHYWAEQGCVILQPYDMEVGAGTFHPATFLGAIGPEPTRAAYVQPSRRPTDGRYGDNPNRLQHYFQYQVVLKPSPVEFQALYLESLRALGIDPLLDDIRFVEDDWESPTLGAWGLGWEVWLNGMEITQVTYFQQVGGLECRPVTGEITYGLERIAMYVQGVDSVFDLDWNGQVSYGELYHQNEYEQSHYNFETANTANLLDEFNACEVACHALTEQKLPLPAYEQVLRASHVFNLLDARRTIGVTERAVYIGRVRALAREVAQCYYESREAKHFPKLRETPSAPPTSKSGATNVFNQAAAQRCASLLLELGTEELPPRAVSNLGTVLERELKKQLFEVGLIASTEVESKWFATPRRVAVSIQDVLARRDDIEKFRRGPALARAFEEDGTPTKAAEGFAKGCGVSVDELETQAIETGEFLVYRYTDIGQSIQEMLPECIQSVLSRLPIPKRMRWGDFEHEFIRPVHWVVLMYGQQVVPVEILAIQSGSQSQGHRFHCIEPVSLNGAENYEQILQEKGHVVVDRSKRRTAICEQLEQLENTFKICALKDDELLDEVTDLVEWPYAFCGEFSPAFLELPPEVLISSMRKHQKYFPAVDSQGALVPRFFGVANIQPSTAVRADRIVLGNARVLRARLSDAKFFFEQDCKSSLEEKLSGLETLVFHRKLGSVAQRSQRIEKLAVEIAKMTGIDIQTVQVAARLAKADLVSEMVGEFPDLQGVMGQYYAALDGHPEAVCQAIREHYMPVAAGSALPDSMDGLVVAIADRLDSLVGLTSAGEVAKGDRDPFSLRRMALAVVCIMIDRNFDLDLRKLLDIAAEGYRSQVAAADNGTPVSPTKENLERLFEFMIERLRHHYIERGFSQDEFNAVHVLKPTRPVEFDKRLRAVADFRKLEECSDLIAANKRIGNILKRTDSPEKLTIDADRFCNSAEKALYGRASELCDEVSQLNKSSQYSEVLSLLAVLRDPIDAFFDNVMVMDEDPQLRDNRIALVSFVYGLFQQVADLSQLQQTKTISAGLAQSAAATVSANLTSVSQ